MSATASSRVLGNVAHDDGHLEQAGALRRAPAALAGDDLVAVADRAHDDRLDDAVGANRSRELLDAARRPSCVRGWNLFGRSRSVSTSSGVAAGRRAGRVGNERAQAAAERGTFFNHGVAPCCARSGGRRARATRARARGRLRRRATSRRRGSRAGRGSALRRAGCCAGSRCRTTRSWKNSRMSRATCWPRFVRSSYIVSRTPAMSSDGLRRRGRGAAWRRDRRALRARSTRS